MKGAQVKEARRLLGWSTERLAAMCVVPTETIRTFEAYSQIRQPRALEPATDRAAAIRAALEAAGVEFTKDVEPGVRLRRVGP